MARPHDEPVLISLSGVDCAGKTTQLERLVDHLERTGRRPRSIWYRPGYSDELNALRAGVRKLRPGAMPHVKADPGAHREAFASPRVRVTWLAIALMDSAMHYALKLRALLLAGHTVVCDRFIDDALMDLAFKFPELEPASRAALNAIRRISPTPDPAFLLTLPHETMLERMVQKAEPFPDPPTIRDRRFAWYNELALSGQYQVLDATRSRDDIHADIVAAVG